MILFRETTSHLQRRDLSSYLKTDQMSSSISANSRIKWYSNMTSSRTGIFRSHPPHSLPNLLRTIPNLNCLAINGAKLDWKGLKSDITSALIHLMHLPTINHIDLSCIENFPLSSLTQSVNLHRLDISQLRDFNEYDEDDSPDIVLLSSRRWCCPNFVNSILQGPSWWRRSWYMLKCKMDDQLSTSQISDDSQCLSRMNQMFDI